MKIKFSGVLLSMALMFAITLGFIPGLESATVVHAADDSGVCVCGNIAWKLDGSTLTISKAEGASSGEMCEECNKASSSTYADCEFGMIVIEDDVSSSGVCSDCGNIKWIINENTLAIYKAENAETGDMCDSCYKNWEIFYSRINNVLVDGGVTSIGSMAFCGMSEMTDCTIYGDVKKIGSSAFQWCPNLSEVMVPCSLNEQIANNDIFWENNGFYELNLTIHYIHHMTVESDDAKDVLTASCSCGECIYKATLTTPVHTAYTGKPIEVTLTSDFPSEMVHITYSGNKLVDGKPVCPGTYTATLIHGDKKVSLKYTITEATAPAKPNKITNVVSGVHVYWPAVSGVSKYGLWRSETGVNGTYKWIANPTVAHFTDTKVTSGKTYYYKVTTLDTVNNVHSAKSAAIGITYVATPDITSRVNQAGGVKLGWNKIVGATGYAIYRKPYSGNSAWVRVATINSPTTLTWTDTSVKANNGTIYKYTIRALAGSNSKTLSGCRGAGRTMVRLTSRTLSSATKASATSIKCSWNTTAQATGYEVRFMVGNTVYKTYSVNSYKTGTKTFTGLKAGQTYKIQVRTYKKVDGVGSFYSAWSTAKTVSL